MGVGKSDSEALEELVKKSMEGADQGALWLDYISSEAEREPDALLMGLDKDNTVVYLSKNLSEKKRFKEILGRKIDNFLNKDDLENYKCLIEKAHLLPYNYVHFRLRRMDVAAELKRDKEGNYLGAIVRVNRLSLKKRFLAILHRSKIGVGKEYPCTETPKMRIVKLETVRSKELVHIRLETMLSSVSSKLARYSLGILHKEYLAGLLEYPIESAGEAKDAEKKPLDVIIDWTKAQTVERKALYILAAFTYGIGRHFPGRLNLEICLNKEDGERYEKCFKLLKEPHKPKRDKMGYIDPSFEKMDKSKFKQIYLALEYSNPAFKKLKKEKITEEDYLHKVTSMYRAAFMRMLTVSGLYCRSPPYKRMKLGLPRFDLTGQRSRNFVENMAPYGSKLEKFEEILQNFGRWKRSRTYSGIIKVYQQPFRKYIQEVYVNPNACLPFHEKAEAKEQPKTEKQSP